MSFCTNEIILVLTGPVHSSFCFLCHVLWPEVIGRIILLWIFTAFRAWSPRESYLCSQTAKLVQEAQIPGVLSQWLIMTWFMLAVCWVLKHPLPVLSDCCAPFTLFSFLNSAITSPFGNDFSFLGTFYLFVFDFILMSRNICVSLRPRVHLSNLVKMKNSF